MVVATFCGQVTPPIENKVKIMKRTAWTIFLILLINSAFGQNYTWITSYQYTCIEISVEFYSRNFSYNSFNSSSVLAAKESQYQSAYNEVSAIYGQMTKLQLINRVNRTYLNDYRDKYFDKIAEDAGRIDLSIEQNKRFVISNFRKPVESNKNIRNEIKILHKLGKEIDFIEHQAYKFSKEQVGDIELKKRNIAGFLSEYENADPSNTQSLLKKYDLYLLMITEFLEY